jgi:galactokinase
MTSLPPPHYPAERALRALDDWSIALRQQWRGIYGDDEALLSTRRELARSVLRRFLDRFGDRPVVVVRCPGRVNLRGMHVDTHGGFLNLLTHQREMLVVAARSGGARCTFANLEPRFPEFGFDLTPLDGAGAAADWDAWMAHGAARGSHGAWSDYAEGAVRRAQCALGNPDFCGIDAVAGSDIPRGAALSSSHALATATLVAAVALHGTALPPLDLLLAVRDTEWFAGARTGTSDQGAMILGRRARLLNVALFPDDLADARPRHVRFPDELAVLVIASGTRRNLSGADRARYTRNRVAYTLALSVLRHEMRVAGYPDDVAAATDRLARVTPERLGGLARLYDLLLKIPEHCPLETLLARYATEPEAAGRVEALAREAGLGAVDALPLRGPLLFGIAESERARGFADALERGDYARLGHWMRLGHDGDRVQTAGGAPHHAPCGDRALRAWSAANRSITECPGAYGASSPALDALVDAAHAGGALGACLTGGGIAGSVLALCTAAQADAVADAVRARLAAPDYAALAGLPGPQSAREIAAAVVRNVAPAGVGMLPLD